MTDGLPVWFVGIDGGATRCRGRVRDRRGAVLAEASGSAANIYSDCAGAIGVLRSLLAELLQKTALERVDWMRIALGLGLAGLSDADDVLRATKSFPGYALVRAANDATTACIGAHGGADGGLVIAGTGSAAIVRIGGAETIFGGRGFILGDAGSGAHIGLDALRAAALAVDGLGPRSALTDEILAEFAYDVVALVRWSREAKPGDFGGFAPRILKSASEKDSVALAIAFSAARAVDALVRRVDAFGAKRIALVGGVGDALRPYLSLDVTGLLSPPLYDAIDGAIIMAGGTVSSEKAGR